MGAKMSTKKPLVVILGSTGTGKTKLSLELAARYGGEIVGADSMQIYKELDIASAKATKQELASYPHHMINILSPHETFTVLQYRNQVIPIIETLFNHQKLPIIVGGTNYYIESILWKILVQNPGESVQDSSNKDHELPSTELHDKLKEVDPEMARRLHPNNKRKILRALEVLQQKGKKLSDIIEEQGEGGKSGGGLRYEDVVVFWLQCQQDVLDRRLNERVDKMIEEGLLKELLNFHKVYCNTQGKPPDYTKGIFQSIGFKEFHSYLMLEPNERNTEDGKKKLQDGIETLKMATRRYARKQIKWTVNRFLGRRDRQVPPIFGLDTTDVSQWTHNVSEKAFLILDNFMSGKKCPISPLEERKVSVPNSMEETYSCEVCGKVLVGENQRDVHFSSRRHRKMVAKVKSETLK